MSDNSSNQQKFEITLGDVYHELRKLQDQMKELTPMSHTLADHETRIRLIEKWKYALPIVTLIAVIDSIIAFYPGHGK